MKSSWHPLGVLRKPKMRSLSCWVSEEYFVTCFIPCCTSGLVSACQSFFLCASDSGAGFVPLAPGRARFCAFGFVVDVFVGVVFFVVADCRARFAPGVGGGGGDF